MNKIVSLCLLAQCMLCTTFPMTIEIFNVYNANGTNTFNVTNNIQFPTYSDPIVFAGISQYKGIAAQSGAVIPTLMANSIGVIVTLTLQGGQWNDSVTLLNVLVGLCNRQD